MSALTSPAAVENGTDVAVNGGASFPLTVVLTWLSNVVLVLVLVVVVLVVVVGRVVVGGGRSVVVGRGFGSVVVVVLVVVVLVLDVVLDVVVLEVVVELEAIELLGCTRCAFAVPATLVASPGLVAV
jgi:hypothetical protein